MSNRHWTACLILAGLFGASSPVQAQFGGGGGGFGGDVKSSISAGPSRYTKLPDMAAASKLQHPCVDQKPERSLAEMVEIFRLDTELAVVVDHAELKEQEVALDTLIEGELQGLSWEEAWELALGAHNLGYILSGSTFWITTQSVVDSTRIVATYDVADLLEEGALGDPALFTPESIVELLETTTPTGPWRATDSEGGQVKVAGTMLIVCQNHRGHAVIDDMLRQVRAGITPPTTELVAVTYRILAPDLLQGDPSAAGNVPQFAMTSWGQFLVQAKDAESKPESLEHYKSILAKALVEGGADRASKFTDLLSELLPKMVAPGSWDAQGGEGTIQAIPGALVVRQTPDVHRQVRRVLKPFVPRANSFGVNPGTGLGGLSPMGLGSGLYQLQNLPKASVEKSAKAPAQSTP